MDERNPIFAERPQTTADRLRFLEDVLRHGPEDIEVAGEPVSPKDNYWTAYLNGEDGRDVEKGLCILLKKNHRLSDLFLSCCKEQAIPFPYTEALMRSALESVYGSAYIQSVAFTSEEMMHTTMWGGALHVTSVIRASGTDDIYILAKDKSGLPYAFSAETVGAYDYIIQSDNPRVRKILNQFEIPVLLPEWYREGAHPTQTELLHSLQEAVLACQGRGIPWQTVSRAIDAVRR